MSYQKSKSVPDPDQPESSGFNTQSQMGLAEVLQMCCLSRRSGQITFRSGESYGFVFIQHGSVLHAMCGPLEGEEAIYTMLTWPGGGFSLNEDILPHKKTVDLTWEQLLFEGARRADSAVPGSMLSSVTIKTANPVISTRAQDTQPKLTISRPDLPAITYELVHEFTHLGRAAGNEVCLPYPSISSRHCIFILSGPDIVLRDLNSSNGTMVNGQAINETILRPGDFIQIGVVEIKFEAGIKRPKLGAHVPALRQNTEPMNMESALRGLTRETVKLPSQKARGTQKEPEPDNSDFVKGVSAISYDNLPKPAVEKEKSPWPVIIISTVILVVVVSAVCYFFL